MVSNIRMLKKFREYFIELKKSGIANRFELDILAIYFPVINTPSSYFQINDPVQDPVALLRLMNQLNDKITGQQRDRIVELYTQIFAHC